MNRLLLIAEFDITTGWQEQHDHILVNVHLPLTNESWFVVPIT